MKYPKYICPVCGYDELDEPAYNEQGNPSFDYCPCCGFQFGVTDLDDQYTFEEWREKWIESGMEWSLENYPKPTDWDPEKQLRNLNN